MEIETGTTRQASRNGAATCPLVGNGLVLAGALIYLAEWVAIVGVGGIDVWFPAGTDPDKVMHGYLGQGDAFAWASGWFGVVLMGRVLYAVALRHGLRQSGHDDPLASFGVFATVFGVVFEVLSSAVVAGTAVAADNGASSSVVTALDTVASAVEGLVWGAAGLGLLALTAAMIRSRLFPRVLCGLGVLAGVPLTVSGLAFNAPNYADVQETLQVAIPLMWAWMVWTGVLMLRRRA